MLRYSFKLEQEAQAIEKAVNDAIANSARTTDLGGSLTTRRMADDIIKYL